MIFGPLLGCSNYRIALLDVVVTGEYTRDNVIIKFELISFQMICCYILHKKAWHWQIKYQNDVPISQMSKFVRILLYSALS